MKDKMNIVGVIPARYASTRFPGKPLVDICGHPMIWWVYQEVKKVKELSEVFVATDDNRIIDYYVCVNGAEPLIKFENIRNVLPDELITGSVYAGYLMRDLLDPAETLDPSNIKLSVLDNGKCIYMSRMPIPYPKGTLSVQYKKLIGIECFNKEALDFYSHTPMGELERIEDIDHLRFIEHGKTVIIKRTDSESLSVDTKNDLEKVRKIMTERLRKEKE